MTTIPRHPTGRPFGTQSDETTLAQIRRADGDTRINANPGPVYAVDPGGPIGDMLARADHDLMIAAVIGGLSVVALILAAGFALFMVGACIVAPEWLAGWV